MPIKKLINRLSNWTSAKNQLSVPVSISDFDVYKEQEIPEEIARKIKEATSSVRMCFYKFHGHSDGGKKIIEAFKELAKKATDEQPIQVSILLNQRGGLAEQVYKPNEDSGLEDLVALQEQYPNFKINVHYQDNIQHLESLIDKQHKEFLRMHWVMNPETSELVLHGQAYTMHGKFCMVDRKLLLMGSSPLDKQAMQCSREIDTVVQIPTQQKADEVLSKLFNTPYAFGRDYYVDKVIGILTKEQQRLQKYSDPIAQDKTENLHQLLLQLSMPSISPQLAFELLKAARPTFEEKRNKWHSVGPKSLRALDQCIELCECSLSVADQEDYDEAVTIQKKASSVSVSTEQQSADPVSVLTVHEELEQQIKPAIF